MTVQGAKPGYMAPPVLSSPSRVFDRARRDALPENAHYEDDGCEVWSHCLTCPLPRCRHDQRGGVRAILNESRDTEIVRMYEAGVAAQRIADAFGISRRSVFRVLALNLGVLALGGHRR